MSDRPAFTEVPRSGCAADTAPESLRLHPLASLFPLLEGGEFDALVESIRSNGQREAIWLDPEGRVLDGRNRLRACRRLGIEPKTRTYHGDGPLLDFVVDQNLRRRQLTPSQRATLALDIEQVLAKEAKARQRLGKQKVADPGERGQARDKAALLTGTNRQYVSDAKKIAKESPKLLMQVRVGEKTLTEAKRELKERTREAARQTNREQVMHAKRPDELDGVFSTILIDPPWDFRDEGDNDVYGCVRPTYAQMSEAEIAALPVGEKAMTDAHLYLWITNRSLLAGKAWRLCEAWGFRPANVITWCKPSIGVGSYYRNNTEHLVFAVRGSLPLRVKDMGTWFEAPRGKHGHSSKPEEAYEIIERCSHGPFLEWFGRGVPREFWTVLGEDQVSDSESTNTTDASVA